MAEAARRMPALFSSSFSAAPGGSVATTTFGSMLANPAPMANTMAASPTTSCGPSVSPPSLSRMPPGMAATTAATPLSRLSFELASTSSLSFCTVVGTTAAREIR